MSEKFVEKKVWARFCDVCHVETSYDTGQCLLCKKDVCLRHIARNGAGWFGGGTICLACAQIGRQYIDRIGQARDRASQEEDAAKEEWKAACVEARKRRTNGMGIEGTENGEA